jgi:hypothetical protein
MRLMNLAQLLYADAIAYCTCGIAVMLLAGGCSGSASKPPQIAINSNGALTADPQVREALASACFDCHSDQKPAVWNARLAPSYLFGVDQARKLLNFFDWRT